MENRRAVQSNPSFESCGFKIVGYYPSWEPYKVDKIRYDKLTHIIYAFAIPTADGTLLPLQNAAVAEYIINNAHSRGVKVLLSIGGWSYKDVPLEPTFMEATDTPEKIVCFGEAIIAMAKEYGFDGVDMDWEHPRDNAVSRQRYEGLMAYLCKRLREEGMLFTTAVLGGVSPQGEIYRDTAAQTDTVLDCVDWINVMAYDGGEGDLSQFSTYELAVNSTWLWRDVRKVPAHKIVLGVPFYGRPNGIPYADILKSDPEAYLRDETIIDGTQIYYNGMLTMWRKAVWALDNVGGIMIWELSQDTLDFRKSLLDMIYNTILIYPPC